MSWYYVIGSEQKGPVTDPDLDSLHRKGTVTNTTLIWRYGMEHWQSYQVAHQNQPLDPPLISGSHLVTCVLSGKRISTDAAILIDGAWVSAEYKDQALQCLREGVPLVSHLPYAGFWIRFAAVFVDGVITGIGCMILIFFFGMLLRMGGVPAETLQIVITLINFLLSLIIGASYEIILIGRNGATIGKMACGIKVSEVDGKPIGYAKSTGRYFAKMLSSLILCIGYIMVAFDDEKRALHDRLCETRVTYK